MDFKVKMFSGPWTDCVMLAKQRIKNQEGQRPKSGFAYEVLCLTGDTANRSSFLGWISVGLIAGSVSGIGMGL